MHRAILLRFCSSLVLALSFLFAQQSSAQVLVYRLSFEQAGESINYAAYQGGYYVAPVNGGQGTLILTRTIGGKKYVAHANFGELFIALKGNVRKAVFSAAAANSVSNTTFFAIGETDDTLDIPTRLSDNALVATELRGYAVSADSERDLPFSSSSATDVGVAGASALLCKLDEGITKGAIAMGRTVADQVTILTDQLADQGYANLNATGTGTGTGTSTGTGTGTTRP